MATILFSAVGAAVGASFGGGLLGLSSVVIGRAIGATLGQAIDRKIFGQRLMGSGAQVVDQGRIDRLRLTGASEGSSIPEIYGRMRVPGQVIWASRFLETVQSQQVVTGGGGGKGGGSDPTTTTVNEYSYSVSVAIAVGVGDIARVGRIWADGNEIARRDLNMRVYRGTEGQLPDPKVEAVEGIGKAPAFRGIAYVVIEDLQLAPYGNRVPQFNFEVVRPQQLGGMPDTDLSSKIRAVAMVPGTGEYALARTPVYIASGPGQTRTVNINSPLGVTDFSASVTAMRAELPQLRSTSLVVSWFGTDLRCGSCSVVPRVEQKAADADNMPWKVSGLSRSQAGLVPYLNGRPVYGGTPADDAVIEALQELPLGGREAMFYPFLLMEQMPGNGLQDPWTGAANQPKLPWRGRITLSTAPGQAGSPDKTAAADAEVAAFFGNALPGDFTVSGTQVTYTGAPDNGYRRFILHYAHLCKAAGGVGAFCIGTEMRSLTQIRGAGGNFPAVEAFRALAADARQILGAGTKIGYAADWSEYFGYHPQDGSGDVLFHLDPLWADSQIDFVGIDNYMPLSDWRDGEHHADASWESIYNLEYLRSNIEGGEGFDWYYNSPEDNDAQIRLPITDGAYGEDWIFRYKDLRSWWSGPHHDRPGGVRSPTPTAWAPESKPIWFTEIGCPSVDKGANSPNLFYDPKSSESALPPYSNGRRDDAMQMQFLIAQLGYWQDPGNNPISSVYGAEMIDMGHAYVWAWDARPFPFFPNNRAIWSDGGNYGRGHWLNGRTSSRALASVVAEICRKSKAADFDISRLDGVVRGFSSDDSGTGRADLQALMLAYGFDAFERGGELVFQSRSGWLDQTIDASAYAETEEVPGTVERVRAPVAEIVGRVRVNGIEAEESYQVQTSEAVFPDETLETVTQADLPLLLTKSETRAIAERWLAEARVARDTRRFALPPSVTDIQVGDVVTLNDETAPGRFRIDRIEQAGLQIIDAVRVEADLYRPSPDPDDTGYTPRAFVTPVPVYPVFLDLPLLTGNEVPHAPHLAVAADPWPGAVSVFKSVATSGFVLNKAVLSPAAIGITETALAMAQPGIFDRGAALRVRMYGGGLQSISEQDLMNGGNAVAIGDGQTDLWEVFQFQTAALVGEDLYDLTLRLRGQLGTDAVAPPTWPAGSLMVPLTPALVQVDLSSSERGLARTYRIGPSSRPVNDPVYVEDTRAFEGIGLRPYSPVHLHVLKDGSGNTLVRWIRRTRIDGDTWSGLDVPLSEDREHYLVRVVSAGVILREVTVPQPDWIYASQAKAQDGATGPYEIHVAQLSDRFGPGPFGRILVDD